MYAKSEKIIKQLDNFYKIIKKVLNKYFMQINAKYVIFRKYYYSLE